MPELSLCPGGLGGGHGWIREMGRFASLFSGAWGRREIKITLHCQLSMVNGQRKPVRLALNNGKNIQQALLYDFKINLQKLYTVPISVDTFQESPLPKNLDSNTIRIQLFGLTSLRSPSIRHVHFESNGLDTADCMWYPQP